MNGILKRGLITLAVTGGFLALGAGVAYADDGTDGDGGLLSGTQALVDVDLPIHISGNGISVGGNSSSSGSGGSSGGGSSSGGSHTSGSNSTGGGTQGIANVNVPITISGTAISVLGDSSSEGSSYEGTNGSGDAGTASTSGEDSALGGSQVVGDINAPVTVSGNAISVVGDSSSSSSFTSLAGASGSGSSGQSGSGQSAPATTSGSDSIAGGTQVLADAGVPITVGGNAISVIGDSHSENADVTNGSGSGSGSGDGATTDGSDGIAGGSQIVANPAAPVTAGGNAVSVIGDSSTSGAQVTSPSAGGGNDPVTTGDDSVLGGTQLVTGVDAPVTLGGNAISVIGDSTVDNPTTGGEEPGEVGGETTTPTDGTTAAAVGGAQLLAATGSTLLVPALAFAMLLLAAGITVLARSRTARS